MRRRAIEDGYEALIALPNERAARPGAVLDRWRRPALTAAHVPPFWRYDLDPVTNPFLHERLPVNAVFNPGAIKHDGRTSRTACATRRRGCATCSTRS
jgi:4-O-beta-D-mannosyl-D-glucose phosphorylase